MSYDQAAAHLTQTDPRFALTKANIRGVDYTVYQNCPGDVVSMMRASREAQQNGAAEYLVFEGERWTFDEFIADIDRLAHVLSTKFNVTRGTRVALAMRNCPELLLGMMAIASLGGVVVFLNGWWTTEELDYALQDSDAKLVLADGDRAARLAPLEQRLGLTVIGVRDAQLRHSFADLMQGVGDVPPADVTIHTDDDFAVMYSSGTTGKPKGVVQTHRGVINAVYSWLLTFVMGPLIEPPEDPDAPAQRPCVLVVTPLFHVTATHPSFMLSMPAGAKIVVMPKWDARRAVELIRDEEVTRFLGVPTQSADLVVAAREMNEELPLLTYIGSGGAKRPAAQVAEIAGTFKNAAVATGWGMTETNAIGIGLLGDDYLKHPGAAGRLYPAVQELRFLDDAGKPVGVGEVGEITVKSPCNMREYLNKPDATAEVLQDGWLRSGDLGFIDAEGIVTIVDRKKNIIIRGGENIACLDVEGALHRHPAVAEACVFSVPHDRLGEVVGAGVQLKPGHSVDEEELKAFLRDHIAKFKVPEHFWFQTTPLPRGTTDKIDRRALQATCLGKDKAHA
ncbi:class I adenylate-forming enzyme family protein [Pseudosulfitobacter koreensis]|uniref:AMP-binding protein n=1 Tax=Pseudosulfitobacter koreensis TaxID=2968472 RepID=A0ABT1Z084_9RHOB|nr:AMP-binding protein [Pseudosulfitobacter koreense]MCR8826541.1 AMP-binding protein [Pseudosulfitobacter koreense]